jgi:hypothetical protein
MCWNETVSLNTFIFSTFAIVFAYYNNIITIFQGLLLLCVFSMQLIEFFLWRNISNKKKNELYSRIAEAVLISQPIFSLLTLTNPVIKYVTVTSYIIYLVFVNVFPLLQSKQPYKTSVGKNGHLRWDWLSTNPFKISIYMLGLFIPLLFWKHKFVFVIAFVTLLASVILYRKDMGISMVLVSKHHISISDILCICQGILQGLGLVGISSGCQCQLDFT